MPAARGWPSPPPCGWSIGFMATPRTCGRHAEPAVAAGLADDDVLLVRVRDRADRRQAFEPHHAHLARGQAQQRIALSRPTSWTIGAGGAGDLAALARLHLDIVDDRADRNVLQRHRVARLDVDALAGDDRVAGLQALRRQDVGLLAVLVADERDEGGAVRIVFEPLDRRRHVELAALEVDDPDSGACGRRRVRALVMRPWLLRPPLLRMPSVSALTGWPFHSSVRSTMTSWRWRRRGRLECLECHALQIPVVTSIVMALGQGHDRLLADPARWPRRPRKRLVLPSRRSVLTAVTLTLKRPSTAALISRLGRVERHAEGHLVVLGAQGRLLGDDRRADQMSYMRWRLTRRSRSAVALLISGAPPDAAPRPGSGPGCRGAGCRRRWRPAAAARRRSGMLRAARRKSVVDRRRRR